MQLKDKIVLITGASSGIGAAAARIFAHEGARLVLGARREAELTAVAEEIQQAGGDVQVLVGDVTHADYAHALVIHAETQFGGLDAAFNNAGALGQMAPVADLDLQSWHDVLATNLTASFFAAQAQIPALERRDGGSLVFTSSFVGSEIGMPGMAAYAAAKAGLGGLIETIAVENGAQGIRANALLPGGTDTSMAAEFGDDPQTRDFVRNLHALKRTAAPEEIAKAALFLISDHSSFVTGASLLADGGNSVSKT